MRPSGYSSRRQNNRRVTA
ncbi:hypothetical protein Gotur_013551 [Gossypium turneri]